LPIPHTADFYSGEASRRTQAGSTFVAASPQSGHSFDQDMAGFGAYAERTITQKQLQFG